MPVFRATFYDVRNVAIGGYEIPVPEVGTAARIVHTLLADNPADPHRRVWRVEIREGADVVLAWLVPIAPESGRYLN